MSVLITEQIEPGIALIKLNRPSKRNALNVELLQALCEQIEELESLPDQRVLILCGEDPVFCSGMDLSEKEEKGDLIAKLYQLLRHSSLLTLAAVQGAVLAGGLGLMGACDLVIAHPKTLFGIPELQRGLIPAQVMVFLVRQIPLRELKEMLFLGEFVESAKAESIGLINRVSENPLSTAIEYAKRSLKGAPEATKRAKKFLNSLDETFSEELQKALSCHREMFKSEEAKKGIESFLRKRG